MLMLAVIRTQGFQYLVAKGEKIRIPALVGEVGRQIEFDKVLLIKETGNTKIGRPYVEGAMVKGIVKKHSRLPKVIIYKFIRRENYRRKKGHRQEFSEVEITEIIDKG